MELNVLSGRIGLIPVKLGPRRVSAGFGGHRGLDLRDIPDGPVEAEGNFIRGAGPYVL
jgi:hypothetical protein